MLKVFNVSVSYGDKNVIKEFSMDFLPNKIYSIIGPSGCGKTTLFKTITGILQPENGSINIGDSEKLSFMMQEDILLPWRTVNDNIRLSTELTTNEVLSDVFISKTLENYGLYNICNLYPNELSAGMKQRVSLIQALMSKPTYLFLDEPFSNLDFDIKLVVQQRLLNLHHISKNTIVIITHDIEDAIALSDYIIILSSQPSTVKKQLKIDFGEVKRDPVLARSDHCFSYYFNLIWEGIKHYTTL